MACLFGHKWDGCKCTKCGKTRDEGHDWDLCKGVCKICGKTRAPEHDWKQYASGWREPFAVPSEEDLSFSAAYYMNKQPARFCEYLSINQVKRMRRTMPL